jgi:hypothetical protein
MFTRSVPRQVRNSRCRRKSSSAAGQPIDCSQALKAKLAGSNSVLRHKDKLQITTFLNKEGTSRKFLLLNKSKGSSSRGLTLCRLDDRSAWLKGELGSNA